MAYIILDEEELGVANKGDYLYFPNVQSCTALAAVLKSGQIIGAHYVMDKPDGAMTKPSKTQNLFKILQKMQTERIKAVYSIYRKIAVKQQWGAVSRFFMFSSAWGYDVQQAEAFVKMLFKPGRLTRIDVECPAMDILFDTSDRTLTIFRRSDASIIKIYLDYLNIKNGLIFVP